MSPSTAHDHVGEEPCFTAIIDGLTKRELFAAMAMSGMCARPALTIATLTPASNIAIAHAINAVALADAMIAELAKDKT